MKILETIPVTNIFLHLTYRLFAITEGTSLDVDCRWPGSCHDTKVNADSNLNKQMVDLEIPIILKQVLAAEEKIPNYLKEILLTL